MNLLNGFAERLRDLPPPKDASPPLQRLRRLPGAYREQTRYVDNLVDMEEVRLFLFQRDITRIGLDSEFRYNRPPVEIDRGKCWYDITSVQPLLMSLSAIEMVEDRPCQYNFVIDLRNPDLLRPLGDVLRMPVVFVGHHLKSELFCLLKLGLPEPAELWDTYIHERAQHLGKFRANKRDAAGTAEEIEEKERLNEMETHFFSLVATCNRYGVTHRHAALKAELQESFLRHAEGLPFSALQIEYSAEDSIVAAELYQLQVARACRTGILRQLITVEMPWVITSAHMEWTGVRVDEAKRERLPAFCREKGAPLAAELAKLGIDNPDSRTQVGKYFKEIGILERFKTRGKYSFDKKQLERFLGLDRAIPLILEARKFRALARDKILRADLVGSDGRVHPIQVLLRAASGRQSTTTPNILGLPSVARPLIVPERGMGIGEIDLSQIEVGVSGAFYNSSRLVDMFNADDVYSMMAKVLHRSTLSEEDVSLSGNDFKKKYPQLRQEMKQNTLGVIYGMTIQGIADALGISRSRADRLWGEFMAMFPDLSRALVFNQDTSFVRGNAASVMGLKRRLPGPPGGIKHPPKWLNNHPIQASACVAFKMAGNRLDRLLPPMGARLIAAVHDAYVFEAPLDTLPEVAQLVSDVMVQSVQELWPELRPRTDINIKNPSCWNKEGKVTEW